MLEDIDIIIGVFIKKIAYQRYINKARTTKTKGAHASLTEQIHAVVNCTPIRVNNITKLTNFMIY